MEHDGNRQYAGCDNVICKSDEIVFLKKKKSKGCEYERRIEQFH